MSTTPSNGNVPAKGVPYFTPIQDPAPGTAISNEWESIPRLFQPLKIRGVEFQNRIWLSPLCQYSADDGKLTDWHMAHLGGILTRGAGLTIIEATAVLPEGRITPEDLGLWSDDLIEPLTRMVTFAHSQSQKIAIQLAHAGRKASTLAPFIHGEAVASEAVGGWPDNVWGPSDIPLSDAYAKPKPLTREGIARVIKAFADAAERSVKAGVDAIEIHAAHGFLLGSFTSLTSNKRTDEYGGSFENRIRLLLEVIDAVRAVIPESMPLFVRIAATEWLEQVLPNEPSWRSEDTARLAPILYEHGVDLLDVSSGGNSSQQKVIPGTGYQVPFAQDVMRAVGATESYPSPSPSTTTPNGVERPSRLLVSAVGSINTGSVAEKVLQEGQADTILVGRQFLEDPATVWTWGDELSQSKGVPVKLAAQLWPFLGRAKRSRL